MAEQRFYDDRGLVWAEAAMRERPGPLLEHGPYQRNPFDSGPSNWSGEH